METEKELEPQVDELLEIIVHEHVCKLCSAKFECTKESCIKNRYTICDICEIDPLGDDNG